MERSAPARRRWRQQLQAQAQSMVFFSCQPLPSMNFRRAGQRFLQLLQGERFTACDFEDRGLAAAAEFGGVGQLRSDIDWNNDRAVTIGVNEIVETHRHSGTANLTTATFGVDPGVRWADRACKG